MHFLSGWVAAFIQPKARITLFSLIGVCLFFLMPQRCWSKDIMHVDFPEQLLHQKFSIQCKALDSLNGIFSGHDHDSVSLVFQKMEIRAEQSGDKGLHYLLGLYRLGWTDKNHPDNEKKLVELTKLAKKQDLLPIEAEALQRLADHYWETKKYSASLENYLFAYDLYSPLKADDFPHKADFLYNLGGRYYHFLDYEAAKTYFLETWRTVPIQQIPNTISKLNTLGLCYMNLGKMDSSNYYYNMAMKSALETNDEVWIGIISGNLGSNYMKEKKYDEAIPWMTRNIEISTRTHQMKDLVFALSGYGELMLEKGENKKALEMEQGALKIMWEKGFSAFGITSRVFPKVARAYAANGDMPMAYAYMDSAYIARDSFMVERNAVFVSGVQHKIDVEKHSSEMLKSEEESGRQRLFQYILMAGILFMFGLAMLFFILMKKLRNTHSKLIQSEKMAALGQLSASIAHEVNTPLGGIKASAEESLNAFTELQSAFSWMLNTLNESEKNNLFEFLATAQPVAISLSTKEEREIKKKIREKFAEMGIENGRFLSEGLVQTGIYEVSPELEKLAGNPHFEKMLFFAFNFFNQQKSNRTVVAAVEKASRIVKAMKKYIHSANNDKMEAVNLRDNIETVLTIYQNRLKIGVQVIKDYETDAAVSGFPDQLNQVWTNLIVNAVQAMDNHGILTIGMVQEGDQVIVKIKDTGKGIPKDIQKKVFSAFFTTKKQGEGSGLGLHIIRRIVQEHSGTIDFESIEGEGTTFYVKLPVQKVE